MYAITGITGQVGGALASTLLKEGAEVRAVARSSTKARPWLERGCSIAIADMHDANALTAAFTGADGVFILIPPMFDPSPDFAEVRGVIAAVHAALNATRPGRTVVLSTVGAQATRPNLLSQLGLVEREIGRLDLPIAFLRAAWFMENASWDVEPARAGTIQSFLQPLDRAIPMVATADIGSTAACLLQEDWQGQRIVEMQGPEPVAPNDIAATFAALLGHPVEARAVPRSEWVGIFRAQGRRNPTPRMQMLDGFNEGWICFEGGGGVEAVTGATTLRTVLSDLLTRGREKQDG
jgi:NAD(P)H dehydrogenase (quinone)